MMQGIYPWTWLYQTRVDDQSLTISLCMCRCEGTCLRDIERNAMGVPVFLSPGDNKVFLAWSHDIFWLCYNELQLNRPSHPHIRWNNLFIAVVACLVNKM